MVVLLNLIFVPQAIGQCSSGPSCPLHTGGATSTCKLIGYNKGWAFKDGTRFQGKSQEAFQFPSKGLYTLAKITKDLLYHFHDLPTEVEDKKDTKKIIEEAIEEKEEAAAEISRKRKQEKRAAKIAACSADAEKSSVARGKRTKSRTDDK